MSLLVGHTVPKVAPIIRVKEGSAEVLPHFKRPGFTFKQFHIAHDGCAMKVGTDAILLGAWAPVSAKARVLDIGTGSGILSLMLAQRCQGKLDVDALDIDAGAIEQARQNIRHSPWPERINCWHHSLQQHQGAAYDLLISNPPYFRHGQSFDSQARLQARHTASLTHRQLLADAARLSHNHSQLALVLPTEAAQQLIMIAPEFGWLLLKRCSVYSTPHKPMIRQLLLFTQAQGALTAKVAQQSELVIHGEGGAYSAPFIALCRDFYLKM